MIIPLLALMLSVLVKITSTLQSLKRSTPCVPISKFSDYCGCGKYEDFAAFKAKRGGTRTSARALPAAASGHRGAEEEMPGAARRSPLSLIAAERARERKLPPTRIWQRRENLLI